MDAFKVHMMGVCIKKLQNFGTEIEFVIKNYTGTLQPLDVGINKPFKDHYTEEFLNFTTSHPNESIQRFHVANWIAAAWEKVSIQNIINTWDKVLPMNNMEQV